MFICLKASEPQQEDSLHLTTKSPGVLILLTPSPNMEASGNFHKIGKRGKLEQFLLWGVGFPFCGTANFVYSVNFSCFFLVTKQIKAEIK